MRHAARVIALCYAALVTVGPIAHAARQGPVRAPALEAEHQAVCAAGHDPAACPIAGLSRTVVSAPRVPTGELAPRIRIAAPPEPQLLPARAAEGPHLTTGPPLPSAPLIARAEPA